MESAAVTLVKGDLRGIVRARKLSRATMRNIRQNLVFAFLYNVLGVPIAAGVLYPFFGLLLSPMIASAAMTLSSVSVIVNSLRLRNVELSICSTPQTGSPRPVRVVRVPPIDIRRAGFTRHPDTIESFFKRFDEYRRARIIPTV